jgi:hypothetical protein
VALLLEHGHRWLATITGALVAALFAWSFFGHWSGAVFATQLFAVSGGLSWLAHEGHAVHGFEGIYFFGLLAFMVWWKRRGKAFEVLGVFLALLLILIFSARAADVDPGRRIPSLAVPAVLLAVGLAGSATPSPAAVGTG